jgi:hypothetical protein
MTEQPIRLSRRERVAWSISGVVLGAAFALLLGRNLPWPWLIGAMVIPAAGLGAIIVGNWWNIVGDEAE